jgi:hypothetical protein
MVRFNFLKMVAVFALIAVLGVPLSSTAAPRTSRGRSATPTAAPLSFAWLQSLFTRAWIKEGCRIDPNGVCLPAPKLRPDEDVLNRSQNPPARRHAS